jgi:hypothetical protein
MAQSSEPPRGARFSHVYIDRGEPIGDSTRARRRIGHQVYEFRALNDELGVEIAREMGVERGHYESWPDFLERIPLRDVLDLITVAFRVLVKDRFSGGQSAQWLRTIQRIFDEENVYYRVDEAGGVHFGVDKAATSTNSAGASEALRLFISDTVACLDRNG